MTLAEMNLQFDRKYNQVFDDSAPSINMVEKSMFLSESQEDIVKDAYDNLDKSEKNRKIIQPLIVNYSVTYNSALNTALSGLRYTFDSKFFEVPSNIWYVSSEYINGDVEVIPTPIDEFNRNVKNPFKKPNTIKAWRLDVADTVNATPKNITEIVYPNTISSYTFRYIKKPSPIILEDLPAGITIDGESTATACKLSSSIHNDIVELAVQKAKLDYEENVNQNRVQLTNKY